MKTKISIIIGLSILITSCINTKKTGIVMLHKNTKIYLKSDRDTVISGVSTKYPIITQYKVSKNTEAVLTEKEDDNYFEISILDESDLKKNKNIFVDKAGKDNDTYYFPDDLSFSLANRKLEKMISYVPGESIKYKEMQWYTQAITIPIKYRPEMKHNGVTVPYDVETDFNAGFSVGRKWRMNNVKYLYLTNKNGEIQDGTIKPYKRSFDLSCGVFAGPTTQTLNADNTDSLVVKDRNVLGINYGFIGVVGINRMNLGLAVGLDSFFGKNLGQAWMYNNKPWIGFVIALDFFEDK